MNRFQVWLGVVLLVWVGAIYLWQNPGLYQPRLSASEINEALHEMEKLPFPAEERGALLVRARQWMESDDGQPVYMLNLMRFFPEVRPLPGAQPFQGTPQESNALYERVVIPQLLKLGGYPLYAGQTHGGNLLEYAPDLDHWNRVLVVRYPSRRAFVQLITSPQYRDVARYKLMALKVVLTPTASELQIPGLPVMAAWASLVLFLSVGWWRAARRTKS
ncbi:MAG TPA: hypothetical protein VFM48_11425 [Aquabacterium sp.]|nr:hypothetical protein [Aquabacterium sp.]